MEDAKLGFGGGDAMVVLGCGGGDEQGLDGTWAADLGTSGCGIGLTFDVGAKGYVEQLLCPLSGGTYGDEIQGGDADFSVQGRVTMVPRRTSCLTSDHATEIASYSFQGENLVMAYPQGVIAFKPVPAAASSPSVIIQFGCFDQDAFRAHPIQNL